MAKYRIAGGNGTGAPPIEALMGGIVAKKDRVMSAYAYSNDLPDNYTRTIGRVGLHGSEHFQVLDVDPVTEFQVYPLLDDERVAMRLKWKMNPGSQFVVRAFVLPSGMTQKYVDEPGGYVGDTPYGDIVIEATFTKPGDSYTTSSKLPFLISSAEEFAGLVQGPGAAWSAIRFVESIPFYLFNDIADVYNWSENVTCEVVVKFIGGVRCVDLQVEEFTYGAGYARDIGTDPNEEYFRPMVTDGKGNPVKTYPRDYPVSKLTTTDPTYGTLLLADVTDRQQHETGAALAQWTAWDESTQPVDELDVVPVSTNSTSFVSLPMTSLTHWDKNYPGWSVSAGGQCQQFKSSNSKREMRDKDALVPVKIWVYGWRTGGANAATLRFQTEDYSVAEMLLTAGAGAWSYTTGHLRCGLGAEDSSVLMMFGKVSGAGYTLYVQHMVVEYLDLP